MPFFLLNTGVGRLDSIASNEAKVPAWFDSQEGHCYVVDDDEAVRDSCAMVPKASTTGAAASIPLVVSLPLWNPDDSSVPDRRHPMGGMSG